MQEHLLDIALILVVALAAALDLATRRIPNPLTVGALALALAARAWPGGAAFLPGLAGAGLGLAVGLPLFAAGGMGGGDVKLMAAVGAFLGPGRLFTALLAMALIGGVMAVVAAVRRRALGRTLAGVGTLLRGGLLRLLVPGTPSTAPTLSGPGAIGIPYGVAIAVGAIVGAFA